jgi:hypothetical protein
MRLPTFQAGFALGQGFVGLTTDNTIGMGHRRVSRLPVPHLERVEVGSGSRPSISRKDGRTMILRALSGMGATPSAENVCQASDSCEGGTEGSPVAHI